METLVALPQKHLPITIEEWAESSHGGYGSLEKKSIASAGTEPRFLHRPASSLVVIPTELYRVQLLSREMTSSWGNIKIPVPAGNGTRHHHVTISERERGREHICPVEIKPLDLKLQEGGG
jgi:hypothetical protein